MTEIEKIIDLIYEAAFVPQHWYTILDHMALVVEAQGASLVNTSLPGTHFLSTPSLDDLKQKMIDEEWFRRNTRADKLLSIPMHGFIDEADYFTEHDYNTQPIFTEVMKPLGYGFGTHTFIEAPSGDKIIFAVEKKKVTGPVKAAAIGYLDQLRPHLARAAMMSGRLAFERINAATEALQITGLPSAVLSQDGRVLGCNTLLEELTAHVRMASGNRLRFFHAPANELLSDALAKYRSTVSLGSHSFVLPGRDVQMPAVVHLIPIKGGARDVFVGAAFFLVVTPVDRSRVPGAEIIQGLFDLTPAEGRIARSLAAGNDVSRTAMDLSISPETVRTHIKRILAKSGMSRQVDIVATIASIRPIE